MSRLENYSWRWLNYKKAWLRELRQCWRIKVVIQILTFKLVRSVQTLCCIECISIYLCLSLKKTVAPSSHFEDWCKIFAQYCKTPWFFLYWLSFKCKSLTWKAEFTLCILSWLLIQLQNYDIYIYEVLQSLQTSRLWALWLWLLSNSAIVLWLILNHGRISVVKQS